MHKVFRLFVIIVFSFSIFTSFRVAETKAAITFPDVTNYADEIQYLNELGIITGYKNGKFGPEDPIKRLQAIQMILRELKIPLGDAPNPNFKDVKPGDYGYEEIAKAAQLKIISGKENGKFDPYGVLTRGQMAKILVKAYGLKGNYDQDFTDVRFDAGEYPYVQTLAAHNISTGYADGSFGPYQTMKRMHFVAFMARLLSDDFKPVDYSKARIRSIEEIALNEQSVVTIEVYDENEELLSQGSGFIVANQLVATNFHVISGGTSAIAVTATGEEFELEGVAAYDEYYDMALLKPVKRIGFPALPLLNYESVKKGEKVVAIGSPLGFQNTISEGIVSGKQVFEDEYGDVKVVQTTAQITFGSSGGPLLNMKGFVAGINSFGLEQINFALASDYMSDLLVDFIGVNFSSIPTDDFVDMPILEDEEFPEENEEDPSLIEGIPVEEEGKQMLSDLFIDMVHDPKLPVIYGINDFGELVSFNYETNQRRKLSFPFPAESIYSANGELYVTLLKSARSSYSKGSGAIAIVEPLSMTNKTQFDIDIDPYDIIADDNYVYVSSGSDQWTDIKSYDKNTGIQKSSQMIRQQSKIELHPNQDRIYAVNSDSSPRDMEVFFINNGVITKGYDSPYHGDYDMEETLTISPDGRYIFNHVGTIFKASPLRNSDMLFLTNIGIPFNDVAFSSDGSSFYVVNQSNIYEYDYESFQILNKYEISGEGYFCFVQNGNVIIVGEEVPSHSKIPKTFISKLDI